MGNIKIASVALAGILAGATTAWFYSELRFKKQLDRLEEDLDLEAQQNAELLAILTETQETPPKPVSPKDILIDKEKFEETRQNLVGVHTTAAVKDETKFIDYTQISTQNDVQRELGLKETSTVEVPTNQVRIISLEEYTSHNGRPKQGLVYYTEDEVLADDSEEMIDPGDIPALVGHALECFGQDSEDDDVVYFSNPRVGVDYDLTRIHDSYSRTVLGVIPEDE